MSNNLFYFDGTKVINFLHKYNITSCKQLIEIKYSNLSNRKAVGEKTKNDIQRFQNKIIIKIPDLIIDNNINDKKRIANNFDLDIPIPEEVVCEFPTKVINYLNKYQITSCKKLMELNYLDISNLESVGKKTKKDILDLQNMVKNRLINLSSKIKEVKLIDDFSILSYTLYFIIYGFSCNNYEKQNELENTLSNLDILDEDRNKLIKIGLLSNSTIKDLLNISTDYLISSEISEKYFEYIKKFICSIYKKNDNFYFDKILSNNPIFDDFHENIELIKDFYIQNISIDLSRVLIDLGIKSFNWENIAKISEKNIVDLIGYNLLCFKAIKELWTLKKTAISLIKDISIGFGKEFYSGYINLISSFLSSITKNGREYNIIVGRLGLIDGKILTLEEIGKKENLTKERVRQIIKNKIPLIKSSITKLNRLFLTLENILYLNSGICTFEELSKEIAIIFNWESYPSEQSLKSLLDLSQRFVIIEGSIEKVSLFNHTCLKCDKFSRILKEEVEKLPNGTLYFKDAIVLFDFFCINNCNFSAIYSFKKSSGFLYNISEQTPNIFVDNGIFYSDNAWAVYQGNKIEKIEAYMLQSNRAMHFTEIHKELCKLYPNEKLTERNIYSYIGRAENLFLWDRGTYIHKKHVNIPVDFIKIIEEDIRNRFIEDIPYISVSGIFNKYKNELISKNIPSESALYSCLREQKFNDLFFSEYPYIQNQKDKERIPLPLIISDFIKSSEEKMDIKIIEDFFIEKLCISRVIFPIHFQDTPGLIRVDRGKYTHIDLLNYSKEDLINIVEYIKEILTKNETSSVEKIFNDKRVTCKMKNINNPYLLYSLLNEFYHDIFLISRFPNIKLLLSENKNIFITDQVIDYIEKKKNVVSLSELFNHFCENLGYSQISVYNIHFRKEILKYSEKYLVHKNSLSWSEEKQKIIESIAMEHLDNQHKIDIPYGFVSYIFNHLHKKLPELSNSIEYTQLLISDILKKADKFLIIGTKQNCFVTKDNQFGIYSLDDLIFFILSKEYQGAAKLSEFVIEMNKRGILQKNITSLMLGENSKIVINDGKIFLKELG